MTELDRFEADCVAAGVTPTDAVKAGGLAASTWFRWKSLTTSPTLRSLEAARLGLGRVVRGRGAAVGAGHDATMAPADADGAENPVRNVSRTDEPGSSPEGAAA